MSANLVSHNHIRAILTAVMRPRPGLFGGSSVRWEDTFLTASTATAIGRELAEANAASVSYRYPMDTYETLPGPIERPRPAEFTYRPVDVETVEALSLLHGYEYQSCERPEYEDSEVHRFIRRAERALIRALPGYDEAPWTLD